MVKRDFSRLFENRTTISWRDGYDGPVWYSPFHLHEYQQQQTFILPERRISSRKQTLAIRDTWGSACAGVLAVRTRSSIVAGQGHYCEWSPYLAKRIERHLCLKHESSFEAGQEEESSKKEKQQNQNFWPEMNGLIERAEFCEYGWSTTLLAFALDSTMLLTQPWAHWSKSFAKEKRSHMNAFSGSIQTVTAPKREEEAFKKGNNTRKIIIA